jgi:homoserine dehydrogenase
MSIRHLTSEQLQTASVEGKVYRCVSYLEKHGDTLRARVQPEVLEQNDPLVVIDPASLIVDFELDVIPGLTIILRIPPEADAPRTVAYEVFADWLRALPTKA